MAEKIKGFRQRKQWDTDIKSIKEKKVGKKLPKDLKNIQVRATDFSYYCEKKGQMWYLQLKEYKNSSQIDKQTPSF